MAALNQVDSRQFIKPTTGVYNLATNIEYPAAYLAQRGPLFVHMKRRTKSKQKRKRESTKEEKDDESEEKPSIQIPYADVADSSFGIKAALLCLTVREGNLEELDEFFRQVPTTKAMNNQALSFAVTRGLVAKVRQLLNTLTLQFTSLVSAFKSAFKNNDCPMMECLLEYPPHRSKLDATFIQEKATEIINIGHHTRIFEVLISFLPDECLSELKTTIQKNTSLLSKDKYLQLIQQYTSDFN